MTKPNYPRKLVFKFLYWSMLILSAHAAVLVVIRWTKGLLPFDAAIASLIYLGTAVAIDWMLEELGE